MNLLGYGGGGGGGGRTPGKCLRNRVFQTTFGIKEICGTAIIRHQNNTKLGARGNSVLATLNGISTCIVGFGNNLRNAEVDCLSRRLIKELNSTDCSHIHNPLTRRPWGLGGLFFSGVQFFPGAHIHIIKNFLPNPFSDPSVACSLRSLWPARFARSG